MLRVAQPAPVQGVGEWLACQDHEPGQWTEWLSHAALDAAFVAGVGAAHQAALRSALAARSGAILPLVVETAALQAQQVIRFAAEQTLTVNTAAAGGNAALLGWPAVILCELRD